MILKFLNFFLQNICEINCLIKTKSWYFYFPSLNWLQGVLIKMENSVTNSISSLLWISIVIPNFKSRLPLSEFSVYHFIIFSSKSVVLVVLVAVLRNQFSKQFVNMADLVLDQIYFGLCKLDGVQEFNER